MTARSAPLLLLLGWTLACATTLSNVERVKAYRAAHDRGDVAAEAAFLAPDARMFFEERKGDGEPLAAGLLDWTPRPYRMTWWLDANGRITAAMVQSIPGDGRVDPTGDRAERFKTILLEWRKAAGLQ